MASVSDGMPVPGSQGYHPWFWHGIYDLETWANTTHSLHICLLPNCKFQRYGL
jgi:hypothetical protein